MNIFIKKFYLSVIFFLLFIMLNLSLFSQQLLNSKQCKQDINSFFENIERTHPNLYYYTDKEIVENKKQYLLQAVDDKTFSVNDFNKLLAKNINSMFDYHTRIDNSIIFTTPNDNNLLLFPLKIKSKQHNFFVEDGRQLLSINSINMSNLFDDFCLYFGNDIHKASLEAFFCDYFAIFLYNEFGFNGSFNIVFKGSSQSISIKGINVDNFKTNEVPFLLELYPKYNTAVIYLNSFMGSLMDEFKVFIDSSFNTILSQNIDNLIIDISYNYGGSDNFWDYLLQYLIKDDVHFVTSAMTTKVTKELKRKISKENSRKEIRESAYLSSIYNAKEGLEINDFDIWTKDSTVTNVFTGNLLLLQGERTSSAAESLSSIFKAYRFGLIVGKETSGNTVSYTNMVGFYMPNSNIYYGCATHQFWNAGGIDDGNGIFPDVELNFCIEKNNISENQIELIIKEVEDKYPYFFKRSKHQP